MTTKVDKLVNHLKQLQTTNYEDPIASRGYNADADAALRLVFHMGREKLKFTSEQQKTVANLLVAAIKPIHINIQGHSFEYRKRLNTLILKKRSALQFLEDNYSKFPIPGNKTLDTVFKEVNLKEAIQILDEIIEEYKDESDSDDADSERDLPGIPTSHFWWD